MKKVTMYLSKGGDSVELKCYSPNGFRSVDYIGDNIHPILQQANNCNTYDAVLALLSNIKNSPECQQYVDLYHMHNSKYPGHHLSFGFFIQKGVAHNDDIDKMIKFVVDRREEALNSCNVCVLQ